MESHKYTIAEVKESLPMVKVIWNGKKYWGAVSGRLNEFASVYPYIVIDHRKKLTHTIIGPIYHVSWDTITNCINNDKFLKLD